MERVFQNVNGTAFLDKGIFTNRELLERCISYGKTCNQRRNVGFFSDDSIGYKYSKKLMESNPLSADLADLLVEINKILGTSFNGILVNKYMDGKTIILARIAMMKLDWIV